MAWNDRRYAMPTLVYQFFKWVLNVFIETGHNKNAHIVKGLTVVCLIEFVLIILLVMASYNFRSDVLDLYPDIETQIVEKKEG